MLYNIHWKRCCGCWHTEFASHDYAEAEAMAKEKAAAGFEEVSVRWMDEAGRYMEEPISEN